MVGNFQETTVSSVHFIGASLCFGFGTIYIWMQVWLTFKQQHFSTSWTNDHGIKYSDYKLACKRFWIWISWLTFALSINNFTIELILTALCWPGVPELLHLAPQLPPGHQGDAGAAGRPGHALPPHSRGGRTRGPPRLRRIGGVREQIQGVL